MVERVRISKICIKYDSKIEVLGLMFGDNTPMFKRYARSPNKIIYPWSLDIVDCYFLTNAFKAASRCASSVKLARKFAGSENEETIILKSAYDLYKIDTDAYGSEVVLVDIGSGCCCYWDIHERFVIAVGTEEFRRIARPYPEDIQRHRYIESMSSSGSIDEGDRADVVYEELVSIRA